MRSRTSLDEVVNLSRADWRFLLPCPKENSFQHLVLLGETSDLPERLVDVGIARQVSCEVPSAQSADALVVLHNAHVNLKAAVSCLAPGGSLYYEIDRRSPSGLLLSPNRVQRLVRELGLTPTGLYWAIPNFIQCKKYLPLDVPGALGWYLKTLFPAMTPIDRLFEIGVRAITGLNSRRLAPLVPCFSVTAIAGSLPFAAPSILGHAALPIRLQKLSLRPFLLTSRYDEGSRVVVMPFTRESRQPLAAMKISRVASFNINTEREQETLAIVRQRLDGTMQDTIPNPFGVLRYGDLAVGLESYAEGNSLVVSSGRWRLPVRHKLDDLHLVADWLAEFHRQAQVKRIEWNPSEIATWIEKPLAAYTRVFGNTAGEESLFAQVRSGAESLLGASLPIVWQHNDFGPWNLYRDGRKLTVIDWEFGHDRERNRFGPPLCDLLYFVTHWRYITECLHSDNTQLQAFRDLFFARRRGGVAVKTIHHVISEYMAQLGIDREFFPILLVYTWIDRAVDRLARQRIWEKTVQEPRLGNRYVDYIRIIADNADQLFPLGRVGAH